MATVLVRHANHGVSYGGSRFQRLLRLLGKLEYSGKKLRFSGIILYTKCTDEVNYNEFIKFCQLPDTFHSWFRLTELHVWMCMVRLMHEGDEGKVVRAQLVDALWKDVDKRIQILGHMSRKQKNESSDELYEQFLASLFLYDEGLQSDDKVLAGALWRHLLQRQCDQPLILEGLVHYVRRQIAHIDGYSRHHILTDGNITWLPLPDVRRYDSL